jgi:hypothetical protein
MSDEPVIIDTPNDLAKYGMGTWTPRRMLEAAGFDFIEDTRRGLRRVRHALNAVTPTRWSSTGHEYGGEPDHNIRLEAAKTLFNLAGLMDRKAREEQEIDRPVAIQIVITGSPDQQLAAPDRSVTLSIGGDVSEQPAEERQPLPVVERRKKRDV